MLYLIFLNTFHQVNDFINSCNLKISIIFLTAIKLDIRMYTKYFKSQFILCPLDLNVCSSRHVLYSKKNCLLQIIYENAHCAETFERSNG